MKPTILHHTHILHAAAILAGSIAHADEIDIKFFAPATATTPDITTLYKPYATDLPSGTLAAPTWVWLNADNSAAATPLRATQRLSTTLQDYFYHLMLRQFAIQFVELSLRCGVNGTGEAEIFRTAAGAHFHGRAVEIRRVTADNRQNSLREVVAREPHDFDREFTGKFE